MREDSKHFLKHLAQGTAILFIAIFLLHSLQIIPGYWGEKTIWFFAASLLLGAFFIALEIKLLSDDEREKSFLVNSLLYLFIATLIIITIAQFFEIEYLMNMKLEFISLSIILGLLVFYSEKKVVHQRNDHLRRIDQEKENFRKEEFSHRFPTISKVPILRNIIGWMYKEGWSYSLLLLAILILAFILRVWNAGKLGLVVDEQFTFETARNVAENFSFKFFDSSYYYRGWPYTILVAISFLIFGVSEFSLRLPGVILGTVTIIPAYYLMKSILTKKPALVGSFILAVFGLHIYYSTYARHYILASFLLVLSLYYTFRFFQSNFKKYKWSSFISTALMIFTLKELLLVPVFYLVFILLIKKLRVDFVKDISWILGYSLPIIATIPMPHLVSSVDEFTLTIPSSSISPLFKLLPWINSWLVQQEGKYFFIEVISKHLPVLIIMLSIFMIVALYFSLRYRKEMIVLLAPLLIFISMNLIGRSKPWTIRQMSFLFPLFVIFSIIAVFSLVNKKETKIILGIILLFGISSPILLIEAHNMNYGTELKGTIFQLTSAEGEYPDYKTPVDYLLENLEEGDIVISDNSISKAYLFRNVDAIYLSDLNEQSDMLLITEFIKNNDRVWILNTIINNNRGHFKKRQGLVRQFLEANEDKVVYIGQDNLSKLYLFNKNDKN